MHVCVQCGITHHTKCARYLLLPHLHSFLKWKWVWMKRENGMCVAWMQEKLFEVRVLYGSSGVVIMTYMWVRECRALNMCVHEYGWARIVTFVLSTFYCASHLYFVSCTRSLITRWYVCLTPPWCSLSHDEMFRYTPLPPPNASRFSHAFAFSSLISVSIYLYLSLFATQVWRRCRRHTHSV